VEFKLNGCINVTEVSYSINGTSPQVLSTSGFCNQLVPEGKVQSTFIVKVRQEDQLVLRAIVDQDWNTSQVPADVGPVKFANDPQTHFVRLRKNDTYFIEHGGKFISSSKVMRKNVTEFLLPAFNAGELTAAQILAIEKLDPNAAAVLTEVVADLVFSGASKNVVGTFRVTFGVENTLLSIWLELQKSFIESRASNVDLCSLRITTYGDMRSFISPASQT